MVIFSGYSGYRYASQAVLNGVSSIGHIAYSAISNIDWDDLALWGRKEYQVLNSGKRGFSYDEARDFLGGLEAFTLSASEIGGKTTHPQSPLFGLDRIKSSYTAEFHITRSAPSGDISKMTVRAMNSQGYYSGELRMRIS